MSTSTAETPWVPVQMDSSERIDCHGYRRSYPRAILCYIGAILTMGFLILIFHWKEDWKLRCMCTSCELHQADFVLIKDIYLRFHVSAIQRKPVGEKHSSRHQMLRTILKMDAVDAEGNLRVFRFHKILYVLDLTQQSIFRLRGLEEGMPCNDLLDNYKNGLTETQSEQRRAIYGDNDIHIRVRSIPVLLVQEVLNPFYIFQIFSVSVWLADEYYYYSGCIIIMSTLSIAISLYTTRKQNLMLSRMVESDTMVQIVRHKNKVVEESEKLLVPGDVIVIPHHGCTMTCDAVLIAGNCIVNESSLTGESVPVTKTPLVQGDGLAEYSRTEHKRHSLFCGTRVIQTRQGGQDEVRAIVVQTGFSTAKGSLVQSIIYPKPMEFRLYRDAMRFIGMLAFMAFLGLIYTFIMMSLKGAVVHRIILRALDIITIAVPPALPAALTIGMVYAQISLKARNIFCISPQRINLSGTLDVFCFDKTGTLTEDGLDLLGVQLANDGRFSPMTTSVRSLPIGPFASTMATCHSLAVIDGELSGDPIDLKMFQATGWSFTEPQRDSGDKYSRVDPPKDANMEESQASKDDSSGITILRQFPFSSALQRMSVVTATSDTEHPVMMAYVKGSPEMISSLSKAGTVPEDFAEVLSDYTQDGLRVLALACKDIANANQETVTNIQRKNVEADLTFLGLLVMQNKLKSESKPVIAELARANIRTVMITGDNVLTAINVARKCGMCGAQDKIVRIQALSEGTSDDPPALSYETVTRDHTQMEEFSDPHTKLKQNEDDSNVALLGLRDTRSHYALDGKTFDVIRQHYQSELQNVVVKGTIFARFLPSQKMQLVEELQGLDYHVGMCGDGANDCGALKAAHAGISLSEAEASIASPFTSKIPNISCVPILIREGRAALVTSFGMFKYMALYSMIQFVSIMILYSITSTLSDLQFHYVDLALSTVSILLMSRGQAYHRISARKPLTKLMTSSVVFSLVAQVTVMALVQTAAFLLLRLMPWFTPLVLSSEDKNILSTETTTVFLMSCYQYIIMGFVYTPTSPFRQPLYTMRLYSAALLIMFIGTSLLLYVPSPHTLRVMELVVLPDYIFKTSLLALALLNFTIACIIEFTLVTSPSFLRFVSLAAWRKPKPPKYSLLAMDVGSKDDPV